MALVCVLGRPARAHEAGLSRGDYRVDGQVVHAELSFARAEIIGLVPGADRDDGALHEFELLAIEPALRRELAAGILVRAGATECTPTIERLRFVEEDGLRCDARFTCAAPTPLPAVTVRWPLLTRLGAGHRHVAQMVFMPQSGPPVPIDAVVHARRSALTFRRPATIPTHAASPAPPPPAPELSIRPPAAPRVRAPWLWIALALLAGLTLGLRAWRRRGA